MIDKIKGAIFDMDGTLINSLIFWDAFWEYLGENYVGDKNFRPTDEEDKAMRTMTLHDAMRYLYSIYKISDSEEKLCKLASDKVEEFYKEKVNLKEGTVEFLEYCKNKGIRMCVASASGKAHIEMALKRFGIDIYFENVFSCEEIGKGKEEPDIYLAAMKFLGTSIEEVCVFEDSLTAIITANKIGMKTVAIYDKFNYGQDEMKKIADEYIAEGETLEKLI